VVNGAYLYIEKGISEVGQVFERGYGAVKAFYFYGLNLFSGGGVSEEFV